MPSNRVILCSECAQWRQQIEDPGDGRVISCDPLPDQDDVPENQRECLLVWEDNPL